MPLTTINPSLSSQAASAAARVIPVAPVNPSVHVSAAKPAAEPGVVNLINPAHKGGSGEAVFVSVSDPVRPGSEAASVPKDWTIHRPVVEKEPEPPPVPLSKMLLDHIKSLWLASASAVQVQQQVRNQVDNSQPVTSGSQGQLAKQALTYTPDKINRTQRS